MERCRDCGKVTSKLYGSMTDRCKSCFNKEFQRLRNRPPYGNNIPGNCRICGAPRERCAC